MRGTALGALGCAAVLTVWILFFPVPLGPVARFAAARALPPGGPAHVTLEGAVFRWRWGEPNLTVELSGITAALPDQPPASVRSLALEIPKSGLRLGRFVPALTIINQPEFTLEFAPDGALAIRARPAAQPTGSTQPPEPPDFVALAPFLPLAGQSARLTISGFVLHLRSPAGETAVPFDRIESTFTRGKDDALRLDLSLALTKGAHPPHLDAHATVQSGSSRVEFALNLPAFATADLPLPPGSSPLPLRATLAGDATGHYDLKSGSIEDIAGGLRITDGELMPPAPASVAVPIHRVEFRGHADGQHAVIETGLLEIAGLRVNLAQLETTFGARPHLRWQAQLSGLKGAEVLPLLPAAVRTRLPFPAEVLEDFALTLTTSRGEATLVRNAGGAWASTAFQAEGRVEVTLGDAPLVCTWRAEQKDERAPLEISAECPAVNPARWPARLIAGTPVAGLDLPLALGAMVTLSPTGALLSARLNLTGGPGKLPPAGPRANILAVRHLEVRLESDQPGHSWRLPLAKMETAEGARVEVTDALIDFAADRLAAQGVVRLTDVPGEFIAAWLPADTWTPFATAGLAPGDVALTRVTVQFNAQAAALPKGGWAPRAATVSSEVLVKVHDTPLAVTAHLTLPEPGEQLEAVVDLAEFNPAQLRLTLPGGVPSPALDFPVSLHAVAGASLAKGLTRASLQLHVGAGQLHATPLLNLEVPVESLSLDAAFDAASQRADIRTLRIAAGGLRLNLHDATSSLAPPHATTGHLELESFNLALPPLLALWPPGLLPEIRRKTLASLRLAEGGGASFEWEGTFDPAGQPALQLARLSGNLRLARIRTVEGASAELADTQFGLTAGRLEIQGVVRVANVPGEFIASWLPVDTAALLATAGLVPRDVALTRAAVQFTARAAAQPTGGWAPRAATASVDVQVKVHEVPLSATARLTLPEPAEQLEAVVELAEFNPARLGLTLPGGIPGSALDFPLSLQAQAHASLAKGLTTAGVQLRVGPGHLHATPLFNAELPVEALSLDAAFDAAGQRAQIRMLRVAAAGLHLTLHDVTSTVAAPYVTTGRLELEPYKLVPLLAYWPRDLLPDVRRDTLAALRAGECTGAKLEWESTFDPAGKPALQLARLRGDLRLAGLEVVRPEVPGPVTVRKLTLGIDYPRLTADLGDIAMPGAKMSVTHVELTGLDTVAPAAALTTKFEADLEEAVRSWRLVTPPGMLSGRVNGTLSLRGPLTAETLDAQLALDTAQTKVALPGLPNIAPAALNATFHLTGWLNPAASPVTEYTVDSPLWLGSPLRTAGRATFAPTDRRPVSVELTTFEHGRTSLQAKMLSPDLDHLQVTLTGADLDAALWMRTALTLADAQVASAAETPPPLSAPVAKIPPQLPVPVANTPSPLPAPVAIIPSPLPAPVATNPGATPPPPAGPAIIVVEVRLQKIDFGTSQQAQARDVHISSRIENGWPVTADLQATTDTGHPLRAGLTTGSGGSQQVQLTIGDAIAWVRTFTAPWRDTPPAPGRYGTLITQLMEVPSDVAGGDFTAGMELRIAEDEWLRGRLSLTHATLVRPPAWLQALAFKSGKTMQKSPLIEELAVGRLVLGQTHADVADAALTGSGFINNLKVQTAHYDFITDKIAIEGTYFGVGFEVSNTLANPFVGLSDKNKLIRAIGQRDEGFFDYDTPAEPAKAAPKKP